MGDAQAAGQGLSGEGLFQFADLARAATAFQLAFAAEERYAGAVIATVFEALEALDQDRGDITLGDGANDSTHGVFSYLNRCSRRSA
ncbi:hypothetical protein D3C81_2194900 [compost metagenome]